MRILLVDNRDSFSWNLVHDLERAGAMVVVKQAADCNQGDAEGFDGIVLSPGPGLPSESQGLMSIVEAWAPHYPILGVCLGLQALVQWSGGNLQQLDVVRHGMSSLACRTAVDPILRDVEGNFEVGHYHSWCADRGSLPSVWTVTAETQDDPKIVLALRHNTLPLHAVQFHPESILTPMGRQMLANWLGTLA